MKQAVSIFADIPAGAGLSGAQLPDVAALPALTTGDFVTLTSPGHPFRAVQALDAPLPGVAVAQPVVPRPRSSGLRRKFPGQALEEAGDLREWTTGLVAA